MNFPGAFRIFRWLAWDTFQQARNSWITWVMLSLSGLCVLLCLSVTIESTGPLKIPGEIELFGGDGQPLAGPNPKPGQLKLAFGSLRVPLFRDVNDEIRFLQSVLATWVAGIAGTLLLVVGTAGFIPEFLEPGLASILLTKPIPKGWLLAGKVVGVLAFAFAQIGIFILGTWTALGIRTGYWPTAYLLGAGVLLLQFVLVYSVAVLLAIVTRHAVPAAIGAVVFWILSFMMNHAHYVLMVQRASTPNGSMEFESSPMKWLSGIVYGIMPKPADLSILLDQIVGTGQTVSLLPEFARIQQMGGFSPAFSIVTSLFFAASVLAIAVVEFGKITY